MDLQHILGWFESDWFWPIWLIVTGSLLALNIVLSRLGVPVRPWRRK